MKYRSGALTHQFGHSQETFLQPDHEDIVYPGRVWNRSKAAFPKRKLYNYPAAAIFVYLITEPNIVVVCLPRGGGGGLFVCFQFLIFIEDKNCTAPQMIPNRKWSSDRKWSPNWTANDPDPQMIPDVDHKWSPRKTRNGMEFVPRVVVSIHN